MTKAPLLLIPRLSEKTNKLVTLNKYVFTVNKTANKVEIRKALEKQHGVKVAFINIITSEGKKRRSGRFTGKRADYKKAIVTLTPDSKKFETIESAS